MFLVVSMRDNIALPTREEEERTVTVEHPKCQGAPWDVCVVERYIDGGG